MDVAEDAESVMENRRNRKASLTTEVLTPASQDRACRGPRARRRGESHMATPEKISGQIINEQIMKHDLVDAFWLKIFPITLGSGKRLFADGTIPAAFKVTESTVTSKGVILVNYERAGAVQTGSV
jgi:hypothetical protein